MHLWQKFDIWFCFWNNLECFWLCLCLNQNAVYLFFIDNIYLSVRSLTEALMPEWRCLRPLHCHRTWIQFEINPNLHFIDFKKHVENHN